MTRARTKRPGWKSPIELRAHRGGLVGFGLLAFALFVLGRAELEFVDRVRMAAADISSVALEAGSEISAFVGGGVEKVAQAVAIYAENDRLRGENAELLEWRARAMELERRVASFEAVLNISYAPIEGVTAASVIADTSGPFSRAVIVNAGANQNVKQGDAALDRYGLVGRVVAVGASSSRILLLTDTTSHVPVVIEPAGVRAILSGDAGKWPELKFLPPEIELQDGAAIVTSGDGGLLPPGLPIGVVRLRGEQPPVAALYADIARVEVVALKRYEFIDDVDMPVLSPPTFPKARPAPEDPAIASNPTPSRN